MQIFIKSSPDLESLQFVLAFKLLTLLLLRHETKKLKIFHSCTDLKCFLFNRNIICFSLLATFVTFVVSSQAHKYLNVFFFTLKLINIIVRSYLTFSFEKFVICQYILLFFFKCQLKISSDKLQTYCFKYFLLIR